MIGRTLGHFRLLEQIGSGGMGVVYRARDERLDRDVALKVLPEGTLADEVARRQFRHEARALSQLNHPNVATVHDFDTEDGIDFLVLEHIEGETLDVRLARGPLPEREVVKLGAQLAAGLEAAHRVRVVHRDLKPGNLRVTPDGRLKILDFGLARLLQPVTDHTTLATQTVTHEIMGTLPYMAPEQLSDGKADARTDLYAAGVVLYETATGRLPFPQTGAPQLMFAIMNEAPPAPSEINRRISPGLESVIAKAMERDPDLRYQSARELRVDLDRLSASRVTAASQPRARKRAPMVPAWALAAVVVAAILGALWVLDPRGLAQRLRGGATGPSNSLAVLPLANLSGDPQQEYFADGMTEELITSLTKISALIVISMSSVKELKGEDRPLKEIGRALRVALVLRGSVMRSADRVRINAQLIDAATNRNVWAESYERNLSDIIALQSEVALAIAREIQVKLTPREEASLSGARTIDPEAHKAYLLGRFDQGRLTLEGTQRAIGHFEEAARMDPGYAPSYAALAECYYILSNWSLPPHEAMPLVRANALKALERDGDLAMAHALLAMVRALYEFKWTEAEAGFQQALRLNPGDAIAHHWYGYILLQLGRFEEAELELQKALELDPLTTATQWHSTWPSFYRGDFQRTVADLRKLLSNNANAWSTYSSLGETYEQMGDYDEAIVELRKSLALGGNPWVLAAIGRIHAEAGRRDSALAVLGQLEDLAKGNYVTPYGAATIFAALGDKDRAFTLLEQAFTQRTEDIGLMKIDPRLKPLRGDPRFAILLRRTGLAGP